MSNSPASGFIGTGSTKSGSHGGSADGVSGTSRVASAGSPRTGSLVNKGDDQLVMLVLNGTPSPAPFLRRLWAVATPALLIAADGGASACLAAGLTPHHLVGDFDSLPSSLVELLASRKTIIHRYPEEKDATDGELSLRLAAELGATRVLLTGTRGGRTSQFLGALGLLRLAESLRLPATIREPGEETRVLTGPGRLLIPGQPGDLLSLVPLTACRGLTMKGTRWELAQADLDAGSSRGISNRLAAPPVELELREGTLVVVREWEEPGDRF